MVQLTPTKAAALLPADGEATTQHHSSWRRGAAQERWESAHNAVQQLWQGRDIEPELRQLYSVDPAVIHTTLPQLCNYLLHVAQTTGTESDPAAASLEREFLRMCRTSLSFALELSWLLQAQPRPPEPTGDSVATASAAMLKAKYVTLLLSRIREALRLADLEADPGRVRTLEAWSGEVASVHVSLPGGTSVESSVEAQLVAQLGFVDALTNISDKLRQIERPLRGEALRSQLMALNCFLPEPEAVDAHARWRPILPMVSAETPPHRLARLLEEEAFVLSTKERAPYLVFCEVLVAADEGMGSGGGGGGGEAVEGAWLRQRVVTAAGRVKEATRVAVRSSRRHLNQMREVTSFDRIARRKNRPNGGGGSGGGRGGGAVGGGGLSARAAPTEADGSGGNGKVPEITPRIASEGGDDDDDDDDDQDTDDDVDLPPLKQRAKSDPDLARSGGEWEAVTHAAPVDVQLLGGAPGGGAGACGGGGTGGGGGAGGGGGGGRAARGASGKGGTIGVTNANSSPPPSAVRALPPASPSSSSRLLSPGAAAINAAAADADAEAAAAAVFSACPAAPASPAVPPLEPAESGDADTEPETPGIDDALRPPSMSMDDGRRPTGRVRGESIDGGVDGMDGVGAGAVVGGVGGGGGGVDDGPPESPGRSGSFTRTDGGVDYSMDAGFGELWAERERRLRGASALGGRSDWRLMAFIAKAHDELLQEQFAVQLISDLARIFRNGRLPLRLRPYRILATSPTSGLIEVVANAKSLDSVKKTTPGFVSLPDLFRRRYGGVHSPSFYRARLNFVQSVAAYSVVCYLLQVKDRHNGNILLHADGSVVHIDFGFLLSNSPGKNIGFESAPFKLTREWVEVMGGTRSPWFGYFKLLVVRGLLEARRHQEKLLLSVRATYDGVGGQLPCFRAGEAAIDAMRARFQNQMTTQQFAKFAGNLVHESFDHWRTRTYDAYQRCCVGIA